MYSYDQTNIKKAEHNLSFVLCYWDLTLPKNVN